MYNQFANGEHRDRRPENLLDFAKQQVLHGHNRPDGQSGPLSTIFCDFCDDDDEATLISDIVQGGDTDLTSKMGAAAEITIEDLIYLR